MTLKSNLLYSPSKSIDYSHVQSPLKSYITNTPQPLKLPELSLESFYMNPPSQKFTTFKTP